MSEKQLEQAAEEIRQVLELNDAGRTIKEISQSLNLEEEYIYNILICRQSYSDDAGAIAHMVLLQ